MLHALPIPLNVPDDLMAARDYTDLERRVSKMEEMLDEKFNRLMGKVDDLDAVRNQLTGAVLFVKFVGWGGIVTTVGFIVRAVLEKIP